MARGAQKTGRSTRRPPMMAGAGRHLSLAPQDGEGLHNAEFILVYLNSITKRVGFVAVKGSKGKKKNYHFKK